MEKGFRATISRFRFATFILPTVVEQVSYIEIYMEKIRDLLDTYHTKVRHR